MIVDPGPPHPLEKTRWLYKGMTALVQSQITIRTMVSWVFLPYMTAYLP